MSAQDGGPASPRLDGLTTMRDNLHTQFNTATSVGGLSLRDYFAGQAIVGATSVFFGGSHDNGAAAESMATDAYLLADALLKAREVQP